MFPNILKKIIIFDIKMPHFVVCALLSWQSACLHQNRFFHILCPCILLICVTRELFDAEVNALIIYDVSLLFIMEIWAM